MPKYGINKAVLLGNVGSEPELRYLDHGVAVCNFSLATTERYKNRDGQWVDRTDWHRIVLWRKKAEIAAKYLRMGSGVYVEGRIVTRSWDGQDGQKRYRTEIEALTVRMLDNVQQQPTVASGSVNPAPPAAKTPPPASPDPGTDATKKSNDDNDDLPF